MVVELWASDGRFLVCLSSHGICLHACYDPLYVLFPERQTRNDVRPRERSGHSRSQERGPGFEGRNTRPEKNQYRRLGHGNKRLQNGDGRDAEDDERNGRNARYVNEDGATGDGVHH